jgi:uncharacterized protein
MLIDLRKIEDSTVEFDFDVQPADADLESRFAELEKPASFLGTVRKDGWIAHVVGASDARVRRMCNRCLKKEAQDFSFDVDCGYVKFTMLSEKREAKLEIMGLEYAVIDSNELNLKEVFSEHLLLAMPEIYVCDDKCLGICPECGEKKEKLVCDCNQRSMDPRWAALKDLK